MARTTRPEDYHPFLATLTEADCPYFIEGGQAVNFWAQFYRKKESRLLDYAPFTSKDCDLWIGMPTLEHFETRTDGHLIKGHSPTDGQLAIFETNESPAKIVDLLTGVYGIPPHQIPRAYRRSLMVNGVKILDPIMLLKSKCHCLVKLPQLDRQNEKHLNIMCLIVPLYLHSLLEEVDAETITERQFIQEIKYVTSLKKDGWVRQALKQIQVSLPELIPTREMMNSGLSKINRFAQSL